MRDPKRIDLMLKTLRAYWVQNPDLRLGQILCNMVGLSSTSLNGDPFYIEDDVVLNELRRRTLSGES